MNSGPYRVVMMDGVRKRILEMSSEITDDKLRAQFTSALRIVNAKLESAPTDFGESRDIYPAMQVTVRVAFVSPLIVYFGIHEQARAVAVFVKQIGWYA